MLDLLITASNSIDLDYHYQNVCVVAYACCSPHCPTCGEIVHIRYASSFALVIVTHCDNIRQVVSVADLPLYIYWFFFQLSYGPTQLMVRVRSIISGACFCCFVLDICRFMGLFMHVFFFKYRSKLICRILMFNMQKCLNIIYLLLYACSNAGVMFNKQTYCTYMDLSLSIALSYTAAHYAY
jgi:hypothetical protein